MKIKIEEVAEIERDPDTGKVKCLVNELEDIQLKFDCHIHSTYSFDSFESPKNILFYARTRGIDVLSITDHDTLTFNHELYELAKKFDISGYSKMRKKDLIT